MNTDDSVGTSDHERFMHRCIELANVAKSRGNTPVGSLVVIDGTIVGEGIEEAPAGTNLTGHAEILACQAAVDQIESRRLEGALIYTTAEPCFMCSYVIRQCAIAQVVYGVETPGVGGITSSHPILTDSAPAVWNSAPRVLGGILEMECQRLRSFQP